MRLTQIGRDYVLINEKNLNNTDLIEIPRIHLIKLSFEDPNKEK